jgi:hypothetical protein
MVPIPAVTTMFFFLSSCFHLFHPSFFFHIHYNSNYFFKTWYRDLYVYVLSYAFYVCTFRYAMFLGMLANKFVSAHQAHKLKEQVCFAGPSPAAAEAILFA